MDGLNFDTKMVIDIVQFFVFFIYFAYVIRKYNLLMNDGVRLFLWVYTGLMIGRCLQSIALYLI